MKSRWNEQEANTAISRWGHSHGENFALRVYTSRLIGKEPQLVLHGGGNTSFKTAIKDLFGEPLEVIYVKGSGAPLDAVTPSDLPGLDLNYLRRLRCLESLSDRAMVNELRTHLIDASSPNPSVETLLHAFLPHQFIDHSHADAILALTNQPNGVSLAEEAFDNLVPVLPYVMPGFPLAKAVANVAEKNPDAQGIVLAKHGLFTFGENARVSYERHIELVSKAELFLGQRQSARTLLTPRVNLVADEKSSQTRITQVAPMLRGFLAEKTNNPDQPFKRFVLDWRNTEEIQNFCNSEEAAELVLRGPITPDHVIRTKSLPLYLPNPSWNDEEGLRAQLADAVGRYRKCYDSYFEENVTRFGGQKIKLDSAPRIILLPGLGALCFGDTKQAACIAADITEHTLRTKALAHSVGSYQSLDAHDLFDMEYWSLEQAKLHRHKPRPLEGQVVMITGGGGAIGRGIGSVCAEAGAHIAFADIDRSCAEDAASEIESSYGIGSAAAIEMDVTDDRSVEDAFGAVCMRFGGVDVVVPNAGIAWVSEIERLSSERARTVADVNYVGVLATIREAAKIFRRQGTGGNIIVNASKNVFAPGVEFGAYSASKAAAAQIAKIAALELAPMSVRVNLINADAIFSSGETRSGLWDAVGSDRAQRRGIAITELPDFYRERNLLRVSIEAHHVGRAVVFFASNATPTTGATLPIDGGLPEAFPR